MKKRYVPGRFKMKYKLKRFSVYTRDKICLYILFFGVFTFTFYVKLDFIDEDVYRNMKQKTFRVFQLDSVPVIDESDSLLLVIFTSMKNTTDRDIIQSNTVKNWAQFFPWVQPVIYSTFESGPILSLAERHGWHVHPAPRTNKYGTPFLKEMYIDAMDRYNSMFYGFSNGDILYDDGLIKTLTALKRYQHSLNRTMVIGRRKNYYMKRYTNKTGPLWQKNVVNKVGRTEAHTFTSDAEDYFFVTKDALQWNTIKNVVIGRPAYDNYFVGMARVDNVSIVDATRSLLALHQTGDDGKFAGAKNKDSRYNRNVIGGFNFHKGTINTAAYYETQNDLYNNVFLKRSPAGWKQYRKQLNLEANKTVDHSELVNSKDNNTFNNGTDS